MEIPIGQNQKLACGFLLAPQGKLNKEILDFVLMNMTNGVCDMTNCNCKVKKYKEVHYSASTRYSFDLDRERHGSCHVEVGPKLHKFIFTMKSHISTAFLRHKIVPDFHSGLWKCLFDINICIFAGFADLLGS